jgi:hypothetical protein
MSNGKIRSVAKSRALITGTEREHLAGENGDRRKYEATSRIRARITEELTEDVAVLEEHHPELLEELREVVCDNG